MQPEILKRTDQLLELIRTNKASTADYEELLQLMENHQEDWFVQHLEDYCSQHPAHIPPQIPSSRGEEWLEVLNNVLQADKQTNDLTPASVRSMRAWWRAAAAALLLLTAGGYFYFRNTPATIQPAAAPIVASNIAPGKAGAILTLADGSQVVLDSLGNGLVSAQGGTRVMLQNGQLAYEAGDHATSGAWNTIATPRARQFTLTLHDGTKVWLNAASTLRYPTAFSGKERRVELNGEAYFEVAPQAKQPFRVVLGDTATVEVLGTSFNVNAYPDEATVRTTLLSGKVRVLKQQQQIILQPGQQAVMQQQLTLENTVNTAGAIAWKNGYFNFEGLPLEECMRQISRWYDINIIYNGHIPPLKIKGKTGRDLPLQDLLDGLSDMGLRYKLDGRKLIIQ